VWCCEEESLSKISGLIVSENSIECKMDTEMEYMPLNIKQEVEAATSAEVINGSSASANSNSSSNQSSQAAPDSVENKVSRIH
jgi:hypothetical protein